jgi:lysophospholipase L1-like esterase
MRVAHWLALCAAVIACTHATPVFAPKIDPSFTAVGGARGGYQRVVHLYGDSLMRGKALRRFPEDFTADQRLAEPNWSFRSPAAMLNTTSWRAGAVAVFAGNTGQPNEAFVDLLRRRVAGRIIRAGDVVVLEDSGRHNGDPATYASHWLALRRALANADVTIIMITVPDAITRDELGGVPADYYRYDVAFDGLTHNGATRNAAQAPLPGRSRTILVEMNETLEAPGRLNPDGVHPNIYGQCIMAAAIAAAAELPAPDCPQGPH